MEIGSQVPAWVPTKESIATANMTQFMKELHIQDVKSFHRWSVTHYQDFWHQIVNKLGIVFKDPPKEVCDLSDGVESPIWLPGATLNIVDSCFTAPSSATAIVYADETNKIRTLSYGELNQIVNRIANSLTQKRIKAGDAIAIVMPMTWTAVAIYLAILKMGGVVVSIADSFSSEEIETRLKIANTKLLFTQDFSLWAGKKLALYEKMRNIKANIIIIPQTKNITINLRKEDCTWEDFLGNETTFSSVPCETTSPCHILFSSGTTGIPKAIPWNHTTPIKAASDAYFHQNIQVGDVLTWPSNLGWMMGPWLIFAALINHAAIALYPDAPKDRNFGEFVENAKVTMLGVVPTLVATWRQTRCMENLDWSSIKVFSSTGECSNAEDMLYLMSLAGNKPIIEYCGGTEIGGAYVSSTVIEDNYPSLLSTPAIGSDFEIIDEEGHPSDMGEVAIIPPSMGLSTKLLNADHHRVYYEGMPKSPEGKILRRHGDQLQRLPNGYYSVLGRVDDTMNIGGIKTSAAEIERALNGIENIAEVAAIAIPPLDKGPNLLIIYAATSTQLPKEKIIKEMQQKINQHLNPLFKIYDVIFTQDLPKTASNKIMRRVLRKNYLDSQKP